MVVVEGVGDGVAPDGPKSPSNVFRVEPTPSHFTIKIPKKVVVQTFTHILIYPARSHASLK